ncbi:MAG TPA: toll/interleukin-1 receptor domain-containing protein [Thermoanaerobaculia bacterium]|nr:toll/interleukin-1 receptor domain-containing protein [Thermoanaerobaculia bacterium]
MASLAAEGPRFWDQLLQFIEEGRVVPILGPDLLVSEIGGRPVHLYPFLAERLAEYLEVPADNLSATGALHEVACRFLGQNGQIEEIYSGLKRVFPDRESFPLPAPLLQLAQIRPFKLFVTTTLDPLLQQALDEVRFGGQPRTRVFAYAPSAVQDLDQSVDEMERPAVFHLFGRLSAVPEYVVTEEDTLELVHALQSETRRPSRLFDELDRRQLLLLGGGFPDWLARFFLRISRRERLWLVRGRTDIVADARMRDDPALVAFLKHFSSRTRIYSQGAVEFVAELHRYWTERHPPQEAAPEKPAVPARGPNESPGMVPGSVFLSYASEDRAVVEALKVELESAGVDVWFDRDALEGGDDYERKIRRNIESCSLFVPILTRHTLTTRRRFFRLEWDWADRIAVQAPPNLRFIVPLTLGDVAPDDPSLPDRFRRLHWERLAPEGPNPNIVEMLKRYFREYQRANQAEAP